MDTFYFVLSAYGRIGRPGLRETIPLVDRLYFKFLARVETRKLIHMLGAWATSAGDALTVRYRAISDDALLRHDLASQQSLYDRVASRLVKAAGLAHDGRGTCDPRSQYGGTNRMTLD